MIVVIVAKDLLFEFVTQTNKMVLPSDIHLFFHACNKLYHFVH